MAESSSKTTVPTVCPVERSKEESSFSKGMVVTTKTEESDHGAKVQSSNGASSSPLPVSDEEVTPTPPESSSPSLSENETLTMVTTEDEALSVPLGHKAGGPDRGGESGKSRISGLSCPLVISVDVSCSCMFLRATKFFCSSTCLCVVTVEPCVA